MRYDVSLSVKSYYGKVNCLSKQKYYLLYCVANFPNLVQFNRVTTYKQCLSYHESKFFLHQLVVYVNNKLVVIIIKHNVLNINI